VIDPEWADRLTALLVGNPLLLATSLFEIISAEGFGGSYPTVARWVREQRGPRFRRADAASGADRDSTGRGGPVRLLGLLGVVAAGRAGAGVVVLRDDLVLVALADLVVHDVGRS